MTAPRLKPEADQANHAESVFYPIDDEEPLAESEHQLFPLTYAHAALTAWFANDPTTWVGADMFLYYEEGNPRRVVAPDVFVVSGTQKEELRNIFQTWIEARVPDFILEITAPSSLRNDRVTKFELYQRLGVREYWLYDPTQEGLLTPFLQGNRLVGGAYQPIPVAETSAAGRYIGMSAALGLELHAEADWFRLFDPVAGVYLRNLQESEDALAAEQQALTANQQALATNQQALAANQQALAAERQARLDLERLLREHGIEPPTV